MPRRPQIPPAPLPFPHMLGSGPIDTHERHPCDHFYACGTGRSDGLRPRGYCQNRAKFAVTMYRNTTMTGRMLYCGEHIYGALQRIMAENREAAEHIPGRMGFDVVSLRNPPDPIPIVTDAE